jgi:hypothetical protein
MSTPSHDTIATHVEHLMGRVEKLEAKIEAVMKTQYWQMGAAVGFGCVLTILLPKISAALGLS